MECNLGELHDAENKKQKKWQGEQLKVSQNINGGAETSVLRTGLRVGGKKKPELIA